MGRRLQVARFAAAWVITLARMSPAGDGAPSIAEVVPADTVAVLSLDVGRATRDYDKLDLVRLVRDEEVAEFLAPAFEYLQKETREARAAVALLRMYGIPQTIAGKVDVAIFGAGIIGQDGSLTWFSPTNPPTRQRLDQPDWLVLFPDLLLSIETSGREAFETSVLRALEIPPVQVVTEDATVEGFAHRVTRFEIPGEENGRSLALFHGFVGDRFLASFRQDRLLAASRALATRPSSTLADDESFRAWSDACVRETELVGLYVATKHVAPIVDSFIPGSRDREEFRSTGIGDLAAIGYTMSLDGGRLRDSIAAVLPKERRGFIGLLDAFGSVATELDRIPADADSAVAFGFDLERFFDRLHAFLRQMEPRADENVDEELARLADEIGFHLENDLAKSLGSTFVMHAKIPRNALVPIPDVSASADLRDVDRFKSIVAAARARVTQVQGDILKELEIPGHEGAFYAQVPAPVSPAFCVTGNQLRFALQSRTLKSELSRGEAPRGIRAANQDFQRCLTTTVGDGVADVVFASYFDVAKAAEFGLGVVEQFLPMIEAELPFELDSTSMPLPDTVSSYLSGWMLTARVGDRVAAIEASSPFGGLAPLLIAVVLPSRIGR